MVHWKKQPLVMQNIKLDALKSQFKVDIYHTAGFSKATKLLIKYSLDITLGQSNLLLLNPYGYGSESWCFFSFFSSPSFLFSAIFFLSLENEVMHVDWRKGLKKVILHIITLLCEMLRTLHTVLSKLWQKQLAPKSTYTMMMMMTSTE